jgi:hypothetical protein
MHRWIVAKSAIKHLHQGWIRFQGDHTSTGSERRVYTISNMRAYIKIQVSRAHKLAVEVPQAPCIEWISVIDSNTAQQSEISPDAEIRHDASFV